MKIIINSYKADWNSFKCYPRIWINKASNPNFKHFSIVIRFMWWYFGIQKKQ